MVFLEIVWALFKKAYVKSFRLPALKIITQHLTKNVPANNEFSGKVCWLR